MGAFHQQKTFEAPLRSTRGLRLELGRYTIVPKVDLTDEVEHDKWVLPGGAVLTTDECRALAARNEWPIRVVLY